MSEDINERMSDEECRALDAKLLGFEARGVVAQAKAAQAYARLLVLAEIRDSGQIERISRFLASTYNGAAFPWDPFDLRTLDVAISDDILACLDAIRWGKADLYRLVPGGEPRVRAIIDLWKHTWPAKD